MGNTALNGLRETMIANNKFGIPIIIFESSFPSLLIMLSLSGLRSLRCQKLSQLSYVNGADMAPVAAA
jgi:hypothetical protein